MKKNNSSQKVFGLILIVGSLLMVAFLFTYLQVIGATGFTGPTSNPPTAVGVLGYDPTGPTLEVQADLSMEGNKIVNLFGPPVDDEDAVNKAYADSLTFGAGSGSVYNLACPWEFNDWSFNDEPVIPVSPGSAYNGTFVTDNTQLCTPPQCADGDLELQWTFGAPGDPRGWTGESIQCYETSSGLGASAITMDGTYRGSEVFLHRAGVCVRTCERQ
jgi:hypothetical protein